MNIHDLKPIRDALAEKAASDATSRARARLMNSSDPQWYLAHTGPADSRAVDRLTRGGIEVYYPQMRVLRPIPRREITIKQRHSGIIAKRWVFEPLFRRYLFIRFDLRGGDWRSIFEYAGVHGLIAGEEGGQSLPSPVRECVIEAVRSFEVDGAIPATTKARKIAVAIGDAGRITEGPFTGHDGTVENIPETTIEMLDENVKMRVGLVFLGRRTAVEIPLSAFAKN